MFHVKHWNELETYANAIISKNKSINLISKRAQKSQ